MKAIHPHVENETSQLKMVILGLPQSQGGTPTLEETYDATSYQSLQQGKYPLEEDIEVEMNALHKALLRYDIEVLRPELIKDCNQIFARDVAFTISDKLFVANMIDDRQEEIKAFQPILDRIPKENIVYLPEGLQVEGGDMLLYNDYIFMGTCFEEDFDTYKTARTNKAAIEFFRNYFPSKKIVPLPLIKHDQDPLQSVLHLDCAFQPIAEGKAVIYPEAFARREDYEFIESLFGKENLFRVTQEEACALSTNFFSISPETVLTADHFIRLNHFLTTEWGMEVTTVPYQEVSKQGGLLRCSTCPLIRI